MNIADIKGQFPLYSTDPKLVYLDSAATALLPLSVIQKMDDYYTKYPANIHRGMYEIAQQATTAYEDARNTVASFIGALLEETIFTSGTTQGINMLALLLGKTLQAGDNIVLTRYEHHANFIPWLTLAKEQGIELRFIELNETFELDIEQAKHVINESTKIVAIGHASNSLGLIAPVKELVEQAKQFGAYTIIDAAQSVAHMPIDVKELDCDFLLFSGHKLYGPTGIGVLYGKREHLEAFPPCFTGGDMIKQVSYSDVEWADLPNKFEAGTPNIAGAIGLAQAIRFIEDIGWEDIQAHEQELIDYALEKLSAEVRIIGPQTNQHRIAVFSFMIDGIHPHDIADLLGQHNIAVRAGHHCTQPLMKLLNIVGTTRASMGIYSSKEDIDCLLEEIRRIKALFAKAST